VARRRRIDWTEIRGADALSPIWREDPAPSDLASMLLACGDLFAIEDTDALLKRTVELALGTIGLQRAGAYLYDRSLDIMLGTWGTDLERNVVDEHHAMFRLDDSGRRVFARALTGEAHWTVVDDCPIIANGASETRVVGRGWVVCTPIRSGLVPIGMLYNDAGLTGASVDPTRQARAAGLCALAGMLLGRRMQPARADAAPAGQHPAVRRAVRMLAEDPSLSGTELASRLDVSPSRFARVFKAQIGVSLVAYRNRLRLDRFASLMDAGGSNLLQAALAAGFGSYAQFHRVFNAQRGMRPREYLVRHARE
jgi:methylphosphotriester-DNA--protein-cysteine methyltransferase